MDDSQDASLKVVYHPKQFDDQEAKIPSDTFQKQCFDCCSSFGSQIKLLNIQFQSKRLKLSVY